MSLTSLEQMIAHIDLFKCPKCSGVLEAESGVVCRDCGTEYPVDDDIPCLYVPNEEDEKTEEVTDIVRAFYEERPFPNYEDMETVGDLIRKAEEGRFARKLNDQIPYHTKVLEVGCGTGQLTNYLGVTQRTLFGADMTMNSLRLANDFKRRGELDHVGFYQMNIYQPIFRDESFDVVICNGVLPATADSYGAFLSISKLVKKSGYLLLGLYNKYGRLVTDLRRIIINVFGDRFRVLDPRLRDKELGQSKKEAWFADQYKHPSESKHTIGQILKWFDTNGFEFVYGIPSLKAFESFQEDDGIFEAHDRGNALDHFLVQTRLITQGSYEGGFFTMIGRRRDN